MPLVRGSVEAFTPLVHSPDTSPHCEERPAARSGQRAVALLFPGMPERQVTVTLDQSDAPIRYVDVRGALSADVGDRTTIGLYLDADYAVLSNRAGDEDPVIVEVPLEDALSAAKLGNPSAVLDRVVSTCG